MNRTIGSFKYAGDEYYVAVELVEVRALEDAEPTYLDGVQSVFRVSDGEMMSTDNLGFWKAANDCVNQAALKEPE